MKFSQFQKLNPGMSKSDLIEDLETMCGLPGASKEDTAEYCEALEDFYAWGLHKENPLRTVVVSATRTAPTVRKNPITTILLIAAIVGIGIWYFKFYKK